MVQDRKAGRSHSNCEGADLLDLLLSARDAHSGEAFSDEQVQADAMTYILAGHDTTSALMTWLMRDLGMRPKLWAECRAEVERVTEGGELREEHLSALTLLTACIYESSRLRPPVPVVSLQASVDHLLTPEGGKPPLFVPKDTNLFSDAYAVHRSTELWGPTAGEWDEQRWVKGSASYHKPKHPAAFNTFSLGTRSCIGSQFALMEAKGGASHADIAHCPLSPALLPLPFLSDLNHPHCWCGACVASDDGAAAPLGDAGDRAGPVGCADAEDLCTARTRTVRATDARVIASDARDRVQIYNCALVYDLQLS